MASFEVRGFGEVFGSLETMAKLPPAVKIRMLNEMGKVAAAAEKKKGIEYDVRDPKSNVHIVDKLKVNKPTITDTGGYVTITFEGTRKRGNTKTRNAEIAFINEYGRRGATKKMAARQFIRDALKEAGDEINAAGEKVYNEWLDSIEQNR